MTATHWKHSVVTAAMVGAVAWFMGTPAQLAAQSTSTETGSASQSKIPRMPDGHPDLSGVW